MDTQTRCMFNNKRTYINYKLYMIQNAITAFHHLFPYKFYIKFNCFCID